MLCSRSVTIALVGLLGLLMAARQVHAQDAMLQPSKDPAVFKAQLLQATQLTRKNIRDIQALSPDDSSPLDPAVTESCHRVYALLRAAQWGMNVAIGQQTYKDPLLVLAQKKTEEAWNLTRESAQSWGGTRAEYISRSVENLSRSLRLAQQALAMLP